MTLICRDAFEGDLNFDLGNLTAFDPSPVDAELFATDSDAACLSVASKITQALVAQLFALPSEAVDVSRVAQLPAPTTALPRAKPVPKPREPTKWEKFAQQKGITKHKRSREVWDEETKELKRRHGFNSIKDDRPAIIEAKASDQVGLSCCAPWPLQQQAFTHAIIIQRASPWCTHLLLQEVQLALPLHHGPAVLTGLVW